MYGFYCKGSKVRDGERINLLLRIGENLKHSSERPLVTQTLRAWMWEPFQALEDTIPLCNSLVECSLVHTKTITAFARLPATILPCPSIHVLKSQLIGAAQKCFSLLHPAISALVQKLSASLPTTTFRQLSLLS
jgi:hypothetical protein